ncbi:23S rRNA (adenine(2503)-C(2))-methyltransferase RlmN [Cyclobacteriaceae bacterium]|jgi:23S rRNA (adenine2503-C2)-methyltransferase|nr:23S rRNA (adenine(2503)-C(2))-methyltransferase RlmN [Cyclobacteriaceae bacterium]MDB4603180.1 23S rRNA (adenine(2503)-C(2))-methyltransferase RlmN [Cyclobacteriaceae bacterium]MDB9939196.1 23S rRNA (adenine(2503)-C(2))-methyltransferase RlmN [Cyclobacteriaceae bacterium]MDC1370039.1 23S rRNA (adenine(2503)-C(2))-methyltransferase RlmN [Cyclobacteriaceae bacterium]|tara:strand:- start:723 stop:1754 length:1032 start_codon:yes stop_codon:yes gene_type:complete
MKQDVRKLTFDKLKDYVLETGLPAFRAKQIWEWIWVKSAHNFDEMSNLSLTMRAQLAKDFDILPISVQTDQKSNDGTIKLAFALHDKSLVEGVLIPAEDRMTACVSSQVGCSLSCKFCATGYMDRKRNLDPAEIYDQVVEIDKQAKRHFDVPLSNIVFMGMGEPLLNYKNVLQSIERITATDGLNMSPKRITVSTAGIAKMIIKLADDQVKFNLALSLHAANDVKRNQIMPINETNTLKVLKEALLYFYQKTGNQITFEYIVFDNFNDRIEDAEELWHFAKSIPSKINIIEYNPIAEAQYQNTTADKLEQFADFLKSKKLTVNIRRSRGKDIDAACGQLANKN